MKKITCSLIFFGFLLFLSISHATLVSLDPCGGDALDCQITNSPPTTVSPNPNDGILLAWDEKQNVTLSEKLYVDRVFDMNADFVGQDTGGIFLQAGTIVSSHYVQWDPYCTSGNTCSGRVNATINTDSDIFAFIYADVKLFGTDDLLGLDNLNYNDFAMRGLEGSNQDQISFNGGSADISWYATSPGDWTRMITAYSPGGEKVPVPVPLALISLGLAIIGFTRKHKA